MRLFPVLYMETEKNTSKKCFPFGAFIVEIAKKGECSGLLTSYLSSCKLQIVYGFV